MQVVRAAGYDASVAGHDREQAQDTVAGLRRRLAVTAVLAIPLGNLSISFALVPALRFPCREALCVLLQNGRLAAEGDPHTVLHHLRMERMPA